MRTLTGLCLVSMLLAAGCSREAGPETAWKEFQAALKAKDGDKAWELLDLDTKGYFDNAGKRARDSATSETGAAAWAAFLECQPSDVKGMTGKKVFAAHVKGMERGHSDDKVKVKNYVCELRDATRIYEINVKLDEADARVTITEGQYNKVDFRNENGVWKVKPQQKYFMWPLDS